MFLGLKIFYNGDVIEQYGGDIFKDKDGIDEEIYKFQLEEDERIVGCRVGAGWMIDWLEFTTQSINQSTNRRQHGKFGGSGGHTYMCDFSDRPEAYLAGIKCEIHVAEELPCIRHLQFVWACSSGKYTTVLNEYLFATVCVTILLKRINNNKCRLSTNCQIIYFGQSAQALSVSVCIFPNSSKSTDDRTMLNSAQRCVMKSSIDVMSNIGRSRDPPDRKICLKKTVGLFYSI